ncbi:hypothetical protein I7648_04720 [Collinsella tanakaei]|nr:hypothetical protein [Collinsella tanakaei]
MAIKPGNLYDNKSIWFDSFAWGDTVMTKQPENGARWGLIREQWLQAACFALCFLAFMLAEAAVNARASTILGPDRVTVTYALGLICTGLGFLSFPLLRKLVHGKRGRACAIFLAGATFIATAVALLTTEQAALFSLSAGLCLLSCGHIGGCVYYNHAMTFQGSSCMGRATGIGMAVAVLIQFLIQSVIPLDAVFLAGMVASILAVVFLASKAPRDWMLDDPLPYSAENKTQKRTALVLILAVVLMSLVSGTIDGVLTAFDSSGTYDVYQGVRLFYAVGLVAAGWVADLQNRQLLPLVTVCFILLSSISTALLSSPAGYFAGVALMYAYSGFYVIFLTVSFCDFAPKTSRPELWAGLGRVARCFAVAVVVPPMPWLYDTWGSTVLTVASCLLSVAVLLVLLPWIIRGGKSEQPLSPEQALEQFCQNCHLTPRESEVLQKLLECDDSLQAIATDLSISVRMVQRYVTSIYEKTGAKSRTGLHQRYTRYMLDNR